MGDYVEILTGFYGECTYCKDGEETRLTKLKAKTTGNTIDVCDPCLNAIFYYHDKFFKMLNDGYTTQEFYDELEKEDLRLREGGLLEE